MDEPQQSESLRGVVEAIRDILVVGFGEEGADTILRRLVAKYAKNEG